MAAPEVAEPRLQQAVDGTAKVASDFEEDPKAALRQKVEDADETGMFSCNICYDMASEPVVTLCGHLYCWPCLYRWLQVQSHCRTCPVCKAGVEKDKVIPIYGRGGNEDPRSKAKEGLEVPEARVPRRPAGQRPVPIVRNPHPGAAWPPQVNMNTQPGIGIIPTLFGVQQGQGQAAMADPLTPEQQHQAFLSRLLLMLGSFVIMCLLLF